MATFSAFWSLAHVARGHAPGPLDPPVSMHTQAVENGVVWIIGVGTGRAGAMAPNFLQSGACPLTFALVICVANNVTISFSDTDIEY